MLESLQSGAMGLRETISGVFSFLGTRNQSEKAVQTYVIREHRSGRAVAEILADPYVTNRCTPEQVKRLLDQPELLHAARDQLTAP
jgi:hypothetical protein